MSNDLAKSLRAKVGSLEEPPDVSARRLRRFHYYMPRYEQRDDFTRNAWPPTGLPARAD